MTLPSDTRIPQRNLAHKVSLTAPKETRAIASIVRAVNTAVRKEAS